jgi:two-component system phosphate regulon sensor histidine kinase PhoR
VRHNLFWKLALTFFALLLGVLVAVDFFAERALRDEYARTAFSQLELIARLAKARPPQLSSVSPASAEDLAALNQWVSQWAAGDVRVTVITADGRVLADSQSDPRTMENHAGRPEIRDALANGQGQSVRRSVTVNRELLYYAIRHDITPGTPIVLRFATPLTTVHETLAAFRRKLWLASVFILLLAGAASLLVSLGFS